MINGNERLRRAVHDRFLLTSAQRKVSCEHIQSHMPLQAEPDPDRQAKRLMAVTHLCRSEADQLARGQKSPSALGLRGDQRLGAERILGDTTDFVGVAFLHSALAAANTVARVLRPLSSPMGSGFMISPCLFMTNNHVVDSIATAEQSLIQFGYEKDRFGIPIAHTIFRLDARKFFETWDIDGLDCTVVAVGPRYSGEAALEQFGYAPLSARTDKHVLGEAVNIIQHPNGDYKQAVLRENRLVGRLNSVLHYVADTEHGTSGSPVFNDQWEAIALHHWGGPHLEDPLEPEDEKSWAVNEGIRVSAIVVALEDRLRALSGEARTLLENALQLGLEANIASSSSRQRGADGPAAGLEPRLEADGSATWTIPLTVNLRLGQFSAPQGLSIGAPSVQPIRRVSDTGAGYISDMVPEAKAPDTDYSTRDGYQDDFLDWGIVARPTLSNSLASQRVPLKKKLGEPTEYELKYHHFSVVLHKKRRLAIWTAVNIDGASWRNVDRTTGTIRPEGTGAEGRELWYIDPRVDPRWQTDDSIYDDQFQPQLIDRGHLVRRQDPAWGSDALAVDADADSFHFSNCAPQVAAFNQGKSMWQGLENWILDNAKKHDQKMVVFTGPVFHRDDPSFRGLEVPRIFWKIVVWDDGGNLFAAALVADQSRLIPEDLSPYERRRSESVGAEWPDPLRASLAHYQSTIIEIERLTGLDFGGLSYYDTFGAGGGESLTGPMRPLASLEDLRLIPGRR